MSRINYYDKDKLLKDFINDPLTQQRIVIKYLGLLLPAYKQQFNSAYNDQLNAVVKHNINDPDSWCKERDKLVDELCILNDFIINNHIKSIIEIGHQTERYNKADFSLHFADEKVLIVEVTQAFTEETHKFNDFLIKLNQKFKISPLLITLICNRMDLARYQAEINLSGESDIKAASYLKRWYILLANVVYNLTEISPIKNFSYMEASLLVANNVNNLDSKTAFNFNEFYSHLPNIQLALCKELIEFINKIINSPQDGIKDNIKKALKEYPAEVNKYIGFIDHNITVINNTINSDMVKKIERLKNLTVQEQDRIKDMFHPLILNHEDCFAEITLLTYPTQTNINQSKIFNQAFNALVNLKCIDFITNLASKIIAPALEKVVSLPQLPIGIGSEHILDYLTTNSKDYEIEKSLHCIRTSIKEKFEKYRKRDKSKDVKECYLVIYNNYPLKSQGASSEMKQKMNDLVKELGTDKQYQSHDYFSHIFITGFIKEDFLFVRQNTQWVLAPESQS